MYADELAKCTAVCCADLQPQTVEALRSPLPDNIACRNLLDHWRVEHLKEDSGKICQTIASNPNVDIFAALYDTKSSWFDRRGIRDVG